MKIGIDLRYVTLGSSGGVPLQIKGVCEAMFRLHPEDDYYIFCTIFNRSLICVQIQQDQTRQTDQSVATNVNQHFHLYSLPTESFFIEMEEILWKEKVDVLFRGFPVKDTLGFARSRQIFLIPDLQHEYLPEFFPPEILQERRDTFNQAMTYAGAIATNTEYTRQTIIDHHQSPEWPGVEHCPDIFLMPPALNLSKLTTIDLDLKPEEKTLVPTGRFFYYPANLWPHKNHRRIFQAFEKFLRETGAKIEFVLTGHPEGWQELQADYASLPIRHLGFVRPSVVYYLYKKAEALIFFSLYEGFGQPLLEAFSAGTPVLCSNTTALPEVGGEAVLSCDPTDINSMSALMKRIYQEPEHRTILAERGRARLRNYSWEQSAQNLYHACQRVFERSRTPRPAEELPLVTVVTPSFNQGRFLKRTIESVLTQSYPRIEYFVIDGGSTDESVDILKSYGDRIRWVSEKDHGQTDAVNKGFARSHGSIRCFLNSDDTLLPGAIEKVVNIFLEYPGYDLVYGKAYYIDDNDRIIGEYNTAKYSFQRLIQDNCICQPAAFWKTHIAEVCGPMDDQLHYSMDFEYWLRIDRLGGRIVFVPEYLANSRIYPETKTISAREKIYREAFQVCRKWAGYVHFSYFQGLWYHRLWEKNTWYTRVLRHIPGLYKLVTRCHYLIYNQDYLRKDFTGKPLHQQLRLGLRSLRSWLTHQMKFLFGFTRPLVRRFRAKRYQVNPRRPVFGVWPDNWLGPVVQFYIKRKNLGQVLYLAGIPATDTTLSIHVEEGPVSHQTLRAGQEILLEVPAETGQRILFRFSTAQRDVKGRYCTMRVTDTNLFAEYDPLS